MSLSTCPNSRAARRYLFGRRTKVASCYRRGMTRCNFRRPTPSVVILATTDRSTRGAATVDWRRMSATPGARVRYSPAAWRRTSTNSRAPDVRDRATGIRYTCLLHCDPAGQPPAFDKSDPRCVAQTSATCIHRAHPTPPTQRYQVVCV
jgi:hypothetical protein